MTVRLLITQSWSARESEIRTQGDLVINAEISACVYKFSFLRQDKSILGSTVQLGKERVKKINRKKISEFSLSSEGPSPPLELENKYIF